MGFGAVQSLSLSLSLSLFTFLPDSKGGLIEDGCSLKKSLLMDMNLALPFITAVLFRLDRYRAVT